MKKSVRTKLLAPRVSSFILLKDWLRYQVSLYLICISVFKGTGPRKRFDYICWLTTLSFVCKQAKPVSQNVLFL